MNENQPNREHRVIFRITIKKLQTYMPYIISNAWYPPKWRTQVPF